MKNRPELLTKFPQPSINGSHGSSFVRVGCRRNQRTRTRVYTFPSKTASVRFGKNWGGGWKTIAEISSASGGGGCLGAFSRANVSWNTIWIPRAHSRNNGNSLSHSLSLLSFRACRLIRSAPLPTLPPTLWSIG